MAFIDPAGCGYANLQGIARTGLLYTARGETILCTHEGSQAFAAFLDGQHRFHGFAVAQQAAWGGFFVPDVRYQVELDSIVEGYDAPAGSVIIAEDNEAIRVTTKEGGFHHSSYVPAPGGSANFPSGANKVGFTRWKLGRLINDEWEELLTIDAAAEGQDDG